MRAHALLLVVVVGCGGQGGAAPFDASNCHYDCFGGYACEGGNIVRYEPRSIPCAEWRGSCPSYVDPIATCLEGCREGARGSIPQMVCEENQLHVPGDPCTTDANCQPTGSEPDGFGGARTTVLVCGAGGTCERVPYEDCNGLDDDGDGTTDEDCLASPGPTACAPLPEPSAWGVMGMERIGLVSGARDRVVLVDELGITTGSLAVTDFSALTTAAGDVVVVQHEPYATTAEVLVLGADASVARRVTLRDLHPERYVLVLAIEGGWLAFDGTWITRHADDGARLEALEHPLVPSVSVPLAGGLMVLRRNEGPSPLWPQLVRVPLEVVTPSVSSELRGANRLIDVGTSIVSAGADAAGVHGLVRYDRASGDELGRTPIGDGSLLSRAGDAVASSWRDGEVLRTRLLDASGTEIGRTVLDLTGVEPGALFAGEMAVGPRIVSVGETTFCILAPAER